MLGRGKDEENPVDEKEAEKIKDRLDEGEVIVMSVRQSRVKPGGAAVVNPSTIFLTDKRVIIRSPTKMGLGEHIEEYFYHQITNIKLEKGMLSAALVFHIPGMTELSKMGRGAALWGKNSDGTIDAIPKKVAEKMYNFIREKIEEAKKQKEESKAAPSAQEDPMKLLKARFVKGEISKEEYEEMKEAIE